MDRRSNAVLSLVVIMVVALLLPAGVLAKGKPTTEASNNLSIPTIMLAGGGFTNVTCGAETWSDLVPPTGNPLDGYPIDPLAYYYVQGVNTWQAPCNNSADTNLSVRAGWGDNLAGDAKLKAGSPIRVELGLFVDGAQAQQGYTVVKLDPAALDRESKYGTLATADDAGVFSATPTDFTTLRVFDNGALLTIAPVGGGTPIYDGKATAEINATGNVVYGYNLRVPTAGDYVITYTTPNVVIGSTDAGAIGEDGKSVSLTITVTSGGGSGGGKPIRP